MLTAEQIKERIGYIGSTDAAGILGVSRWKTPLSVWAEKTGQVVPEDISGKLPVRLGHKLEQAVAELYMEETGRKLVRVNETIFHKKHSFIAANIDRRVVGYREIVEIKNVGAWNKAEWEDGEAPAEYLAQVMHQLAVTGYEKGWLVALIGNSDLKIVPVERNEAALKELIAQEVEFWTQYVIPKVMPFKMTRFDKENLDALFPQAQEGKTVELSDVEVGYAESLESLEEESRFIEGQIEKVKNQLRMSLGDAEAGLAGKYKIYWSNLTVNRFDVEECKEKEPDTYKRFLKPRSSRRFLIKTTTNKEKTNGNGE